VVQIAETLLPAFDVPQDADYQGLAGVRYCAKAVYP
jgi:hypothetical protein